MYISKLCVIKYPNKIGKNGMVESPRFLIPKTFFNICTYWWIIWGFSGDAADTYISKFYLYLLTFLYAKL